MNVALTGVTGHLGAAVLRELHLRGYGIKALVRNEEQRSCAGVPVECIHGDLLKTESLFQLLRNCEAVVHSAACISINGDPFGEVYRTNVEGTRRLLEVAQECGIRRVVCIGSIHAYRQMPVDTVLDEHRPVVGEEGSAYDRSKRDAQAIALAMNRPGMEVVVVNPTALIGPYDFKPSRTGKALIDLVRGRMPFVIRGGFDFCDSRDVACGIVNALTVGRAGEVYILAGKWYSMRDIVSMLADVSGRQIPVIPVPAVVAKAGIPFVHAWSWLSGAEPLFTHEALQAVLQGNRSITAEKARRELDFSARPMYETIRDTFRWFLENGYLKM